MSYDELVGELYLVASNVTSERRKNLLVRAAEAIEELSSENKSLAKSVNQASDILRRRWIPVSERLPERGELVLTANKFDGVNYSYLTNSGDWYSANNIRYDSWTRESYVTHWMPLPKPPEEVEE